MVPGLGHSKVFDRGSSMVCCMFQNRSHKGHTLLDSIFLDPDSVVWVWVSVNNRFHLGAGGFGRARDMVTAHLISVHQRQ